MTHKDEFERTMKLDVEARIREGVKAVLEEIFEEKMTEHLKAGYRELIPTRKGEHNGYYQRNLLTPAVKIKRRQVQIEKDARARDEALKRRIEEISGELRRLGTEASETESRSSKAAAPRAEPDAGYCS